MCNCYSGSMSSHNASRHDAMHRAHAALERLRFTPSRSRGSGDVVSEQRSEKRCYCDWHVLPDANRHLIAGVPHVDFGNLLTGPQDVVPVELGGARVPFLLEKLSSRIDS